MLTRPLKLIRRSQLLRTLLYAFLFLIVVFGIDGMLGTARMQNAPHAGRVAPNAKTEAQSGKTSRNQPGKEAAGEENSEVAVIPLSPSQVRSARPIAPTSINVATNLGEEVEPNDTSATATPLTAAEAKIKGRVFPNGDIDFYSFTASTGDRIYAAVQTSYSASASTDSTLDLLNTDGSTVIETDLDDGSFGTLSSGIAGATIPANGTYFLRVRHNSATVQLRPYFLYFTRRSGAPTAETEPNDTFPGQALPGSGWVSGSTSSATDVDFYSISLNAGDTVFLSLDLDPERDTVEWNGQLGLGTFGTPPNVLVVNDAGTSTPDSESYFMTVKAAGTYGILVGLPTGGTTFGTYHLSVSVLPAASLAGCTTYTSTDVPKVIPDGPGIVTSALTIPDTNRVRRMTVTINLTHNFMADLDVDLTAPTGVGGNTVGLFTDVGSVTAGSQTTMDTTIDDDAGIPIGLFTVVQGPVFEPELNYRLDWFRGQPINGTWTLTIRDDAVGDGGTLTGWSITVCPDTSTALPLTVFTTDFEASDAGFTHSGTADEWERGNPTFAPVTGCNSGTNCWKTDLDNSYNASSNQDLLSPSINLAGLTQAQLSWAQKFQIESATFDHYFVEVRQVGNPSNSKKVFEWDGATMTNTVGNPSVTVQEAAGWGLFRADISSFVGLNVEVRFHFDSDSSVQLAGVAIDDFSVTGVGSCALTCPANVTVSNDPNQCGAVVNYPAPMTSGTCGTVTCSPPSGSFFPVGTTMVTCTATAGPSCSFNVTVNDTQPPTITCPANVTTTNPVVNYPAPTVSDNCPGVGAPTCVPPSGSTFPLGTTTVNCMTTDASGNTASCSFTVTVNAVVEQQKWTSVASSGTLDEDSLALAGLDDFTVRFLGTNTGTINVRYNITPVSGIARFCPATNSVVKVRFRDSDGAANNARVMFEIHRTNTVTGGNVLVYTFDSNTAGQPADAAFHTFMQTVAGLDFDFSTNIYWIEAKISRNNSALFSDLGLIQIHESTGTTCP